jgi:hypothetical protein
MRYECLGSVCACDLELSHYSKTDNTEAVFRSVWHAYHSRMRKHLNGYKAEKELLRICSTVMPAVRLTLK